MNPPNEAIAFPLCTQWFAAACKGGLRGDQTARSPLESGPKKLHPQTAVILSTSV